MKIPHKFVTFLVRPVVKKWKDQLMDSVLQDFALTGSETAFRMLADRHMDAVYSQCVRRLGDRTLAEDVTQAVFALLAQKAKRLPPGTIVGGWLYIAAQYACLNAKRDQSRRRDHERVAASMKAEANSSTVSTEKWWIDVQAELDDAIGSLGEKHRNVIVLRYLEGMSMAEVGSVLGVSEDAAKRRVSRALEMLRSSFAGKGKPVASVAVLERTLGAFAIVPRPENLLDKTISAAMGRGTVNSALTEGMAPMTVSTNIFSVTAVVLGVTGIVVAGGLVLNGLTAVPPSDPHNQKQPVQAVAEVAKKRPTTVPTKLNGFWVPVKEEAAAREDAKRVVLKSVLIADDTIVMTSAFDSEAEGPGEKRTILQVTKVREESTPPIIEAVLRDGSANQVGERSDSVGVPTVIAYGINEDGILRLALGKPGREPTSLDQADGQMVLVLKGTHSAKP